MTTIESIKEEKIKRFQKYYATLSVDERNELKRAVLSWNVYNAVRYSLAVEVNALTQASLTWYIVGTVNDYFMVEVRNFDRLLPEIKEIILDG